MVQQMRMGNQPSPKQQAKKVEEIASAAREAAVARAAAEPDDVADPRVTDRMLKRVILFSGTPVFFGLLLFPFFWYLKVFHAHGANFDCCDVMGHSITWKNGPAGCSKSRAANGHCFRQLGPRIWSWAFGYYIWSGVRIMGSG